MTENSPSFWQKQQSDYTLVDTLKYIGLMTPVVMAAPYVVLGGIGVAYLSYDAAKKKYKALKARKKK